MSFPGLSVQPVLPAPVGAAQVAPPRGPGEMNHGASQRYIADLSDLDQSRTVHTTGQSGQFFHPHREDFISLWQNVEYHPMLFSREEVEAHTQAQLTLVPQ